MKRIKEILINISVIGITLGGFDADELIWWLISLLIKPSAEIFEILFYIFTFIPIPFCWWLVFKLTTTEINKY